MRRGREGEVTEAVFFPIGEKASQRGAHRLPLFYEAVFCL